MMMPNLARVRAIVILCNSFVSQSAPVLLRRTALVMVNGFSLPWKGLTVKRSVS